LGAAGIIEEEVKPEERRKGSGAVRRFLTGFWDGIDEWWQNTSNDGLW
jgi:hypothetical protein